MPENRTPSSADLDQIDGGGYTYIPDESKIRITVPLGSSDPSNYTIRQNIGESSSEIRSATHPGRFGDEGMYGPGEVPGHHRHHFDPETPFRAGLSAGSEFNHEYIEFQPLARPTDGNFFLVDIILPEGIQTTEPLNSNLDDSALSFPNRFDIELNQSHIDGGGIEALSTEADLTEFETEVARLMIAHFVETHAERLGYDFSVHMKWGVVNAIAVMLATELANVMDETDD